MIGIYKITSPSERIYIGQSRNIDKRWYTYKTSHFKTQYRLYSSIQKYGYENHIFEIIEECEIEDLNIRERYWQEFYDVLSRKGLNCSLVSTKDKPRVFSKEVREKISISNKGKIHIHTEEGLKNVQENQFKKGHSMHNKKVINTFTSEIFESAKICHLKENLKMTVGHFRDMMSGLKTNKTIYKYLKNYEQ